jgi:hypothetical protein
MNFKKSSLIPVIIAVMIGSAFCKKDTTEGQFTISNISLSICKLVISSGDGVLKEYINILTVNNNYLQFSHINSVFNCDTEQIKLAFERAGNTITINEDEIVYASTCTCAYDIKFRFGPFLNETYTLVLQKGGKTFKEFSFEFTTDTNEKIDLN